LVATSGATLPCTFPAHSISQIVVAVKRDWCYAGSMIGQSPLYL